MKKSLPINILSFCLLLALTTFGQSRNNRPKDLFGAGVLLGVNASQIDGDHVSGFSKKGIYGGLRGIVHFSQRTQLNIELIYSQKGSQWGIEPNGFRTLTGGTIKVDYVEIPVLLKYYTGEKQKIYLETGFSYGRKTRHILDEPKPRIISQEEFNSIAVDFKSGEVNLIAGLGHRFGNHLNVGLRSTWGLTAFYNIPEEEIPDQGQLSPDEIFRLRNYLLTLFVVYELGWD